MSTKCKVPAVGYRLSSEGHAQLCRITEHLLLLAELAKGYSPPDDKSSLPITVPQWVGCLLSISDGLDAVLGSLEWQGEALEEE